MQNKASSSSAVEPLTSAWILQLLQCLRSLSLSPSLSLCLSSPLPHLTSDTTLNRAISRSSAMTLPMLADKQESRGVIANFVDWCEKVVLQ